jgi:predicted negative regulator of RcsB-dependent stress response
VGAKKIKAVRKPVYKKPVVPQETPLERLKNWGDEHSSLIVKVGSAVLILFLAIWGFSGYEKSKQTQAQSDYATLASKFPAEGTGSQADWEKLIPDLQKFISEHKGTGPAVNAQLELATAFFEAKHYDDAIKTASDALAAAPKGHSLRPLLYYQLAYAYRSAGKPDQAAQAWTDLKNTGLVDFEREADWNLGTIYMEKKDFAKAMEMFQLASKAPGAYPPTALIEQQLANAKSEAGTPDKQANKKD